MLTKEKMKKILIFEIIIIYFDGLLTDMLHVPQIISFIPDILNIVLFIGIYNKRTVIRLKESTDKAIFLFMVWSVITAILNFVSPILYIWEMRNFCRAIILYYITINLFSSDDCQKIYSYMKKLVILNFVVTLYQYFILGFKQDFLGGIFGIHSGVNSSTNILLCIAFTISIIKYLQKEEKFKWVFCVTVISFIIAALAELKIFFVEFIIIFILSIILIKPSSKTIIIIFLSICSLLLGLMLLKIVFPVHYETIMNLGKLKQYADMHGGGYGISRINMINDVNELFFEENYINRILGLGMGNCTMSSSFSFLTSDFYVKNKELNYNWFSHAMLYLQTGIIGLILYLFIFISIIMKSLYRIFIKKEKNVYYFFNIIFCIILILNIMYNHWARTETSYIVYLALAVSYIETKNKYKNDLGAHK